MRFAFVSTMKSSPWGGSEELWSQAALRLKGLGHDVAAVVCWWPELHAKIERLRAEGIPLLFWNRGLSALSPFEKMTRRITGWEKAILGEHQQLKDCKPDLTVISQGGAIDGIEWMSFCVEQDLAFVPVVQCNSDNWWPSDEFAAKLRGAYSQARASFFVSKASADELELQIGMSLYQAEIARNPFNNVSVDYIPRWPVAPPWRAACVARLEPKAKGQDLLLRVLANPKWRSRDFTVNLYGAGASEAILKRLVSKYQLESIRFAGHTNDVQGIWETNHILLLPSRYEGLPLALVESMWAARPAVITDVSGNAELCINGQSAFIAEAPTVKCLDDALEHAWENKERWKAMGSEARSLAEQILPKDPVGVFTTRLLQLAEPSSKKVTDPWPVGWRR
jgi:glycosyltransferase involved in cell wall biosynthesis